MTLSFSLFPLLSFLFLCLSFLSFFLSLSLFLSFFLCFFLCFFVSFFVSLFVCLFVSFFLSFFYSRFLSIYLSFSERFFVSRLCLFFSPSLFYLFLTSLSLCLSTCPSVCLLFYIPTWSIPSLSPPLSFSLSAFSFSRS